MDLGATVIRSALENASRKSLRFGITQGDKILRVQLQESLTELNALKIKVLQQGEINLNIIPEIESAPVPAVVATTVSKEDVLNRITWDDLLERATKMAEDDYEYYKEELYKMTIAQQQPVALLDLDGLQRAVGFEGPDFLFNALHRPTLVYYAALRKAADVEVTKRYEDIMMNDTLGSGKLAYHVALTPSQWMVDVLDLIGGSGRPGRPTFVDLEDKAFRTTKNARVLDGGVVGGGNRVDTVDLKTYAIDLPYHLGNFANIFGTVYFAPDKSFKSMFKNATYTDVQLLIHFAAAGSTRIKYDDLWPTKRPT